MMYSRLMLLVLPALVLGGGHTSGSSSSSSSSAEAGSGDTDGWQQGAACYGYGGGHGVWKCGTSAAWCTELGGVARYVEGYKSRRSGKCMCKDGCPADSIQPGFTKDGTHDGFACYGSGGGHGVKCGMSKADCEGASGISYDPGYVSARSGCCLCDENCDHTAETGTDCKYTNEVVASPAPPPLPPSPPPSPMFPPLVGESFHTVTVSLNVTGSLEDYTPAKASLIAAKFAVACGVHSDDITVSFMAGSVIITVAIKVPDEAAVTKVETAIAAAMPDAKTATSFLGGSYGAILYRKSVQSVGVVEKTAPPGLGTGILVVIIVAGVVVVLVVALVAKMMMGKKPAVKSAV